MSMYKLSLNKFDVIASYLSVYEAGHFRYSYWFNHIYTMNEPVKKKQYCEVSAYPIITINRLTPRIRTLEITEKFLIGRDK